MTAKVPPVPPANRSPKGPGAGKRAPRDTSRRDAVTENPEQQGDEGNIAQNTTNQSHQQDS
jgi:hypothetical protein